MPWFGGPFSVCPLLVLTGLPYYCGLEENSSYRIWLTPLSLVLIYWKTKIPVFRVQEAAMRSQFPSKCNGHRCIAGAETTMVSVSRNLMRLGATHLSFAEGWIYDRPGYNNLLKVVIRKIRS